MIRWLHSVVGLTVSALKSRRNLLLENAALRHQLLVLSRRTVPGGHRILPASAQKGVSPGKQECGLGDRVGAAWGQFPGTKGQSPPSRRSMMAPETRCLHFEDTRDHQRLPRRANHRGLNELPFGTDPDAWESLDGHPHSDFQGLVSRAAAQEPGGEQAGHRVDMR